MPGPHEANYHLTFKIFSSPFNGGYKELQLLMELIDLSVLRRRENQDSCLPHAQFL